VRLVWRDVYYSGGEKIENLTLTRPALDSASEEAGAQAKADGAVCVRPS
jgi:hypothetical protein